VDISELGITIYNGDFYIAFCQLTACPDSDMVSIDSSEPHYGRSWSLCEGCSSWLLHESWDFMIRCVVDVAEDCPWLDESPKSGSVEPGSSDAITINISAVGLVPGNYEAQIVVAHNDPNENPVIVPVNLLVDNPPSALSNPTPANHATDVDTDADLRWAGGDPDAGDTVTYDVYFGTSSAPPYVETVGPYPASQTFLAYDPGVLAHGTAYYWKIVAADNHAVLGIGPGLDFTTLVEEEFDPWYYDEDGSGAIEKNEALAAVSDYFEGLITKVQVMQVIVLYFD